MSPCAWCGASCDGPGTFGSPCPACAALTAAELAAQFPVEYSAWESTVREEAFGVLEEGTSPGAEPVKSRAGGGGKVLEEKLSPTQRECLRQMGVSPLGTLERWRGGFWTVPGANVARPGVPAWSVNVTTARALEKRGLVARSNPVLAEWQDTFVLTARGRVLAHE